MLFLDNQNTSVQVVINKCFEWSDGVDIAVAFIRMSGVTLVDSSIKRLLQKDGRMRIIVGKDFGYTDVDALHYLKSIGADVKIFIGDVIFHPKCYIFRKSGFAKVILGSSNWTASGLNAGVEWNLCLDESEADLRCIINAYELLWTSPSVREISDEILLEMRSDERIIKQKELIDRFDFKFKVIEFPFDVNPSFLSNQYYCPITIPNEHNWILKEYFSSQSPSAFVTIETPSSEAVDGKIHNSISSWSPYYQIRSLKKGEQTLRHQFRMNERIIVKVILNKANIIVQLSKSKQPQEIWR